MKDKPEVIDDLMNEYMKKTGRRKYTNKHLDIVKIGDNNDS